MNNPRSIRIQEYDYPLPDCRIAQFPLAERDQSKLLILRDGVVSEDVFSNLANFLPSDNLVIFNETRVIHARLIFHKVSGSRIEVFCLDPLEPADIQLAFQQKGSCLWKCFIGNAKRWKQETLELETELEGMKIRLKAEKTETLEEAFKVRFSWFPAELPFSVILETFGKIPLPPYIGREAEDPDYQRYQTVYARNDGSVAAPTAGLHFTPGVFDSLRKKGIITDKITLHVGAGTFKPVNTETVEDHHMHAEQVIIPLEVISRILACQEKNITLVGTTTVRSIESLYWQGVKWLRNKPQNPLMQVDQWDPYHPDYNTGISVNEALSCVLENLNSFDTQNLRGTTSLLIAPGYSYKIPTAIITNFHQPKSTLLLLVSAFIGPAWRKAYDFALAHDFRFLSYGDSCLFFRKPGV